MSLPAMRVDHLSVAVRDVAPALTFLRRHLPIRMHQEPGPGYVDTFNWTDFFIGDWKLELIESARPGSFVERFLARRGEGMHHLSLDVAGGTLDGYLALLERQGLRIVDYGRYQGGAATAFISPRTGPGILVQFWEMPGDDARRPANYPTATVAERDGVRYCVDHVALAVRSIATTVDWFRRTFPVEVDPVRSDRNGAHHECTLWLAGFKLALLEPARADGFVARFLARRGEGFHHLTIDVDRLEPVVDHLAADGIGAVDRAEVAGRRSAFVHPRDAHGVALQFREEPGLDGPRRR